MCVGGGGAGGQGIIVVCINPCPADPGYALPLQTVLVQISWLFQKPTDLDLHCLSFTAS